MCMYIQLRLRVGICAKERCVFVCECVRERERETEREKESVCVRGRCVLCEREVCVCVRVWCVFL